MPIVYSYDCHKGKRLKQDDAVAVSKNKDGDVLATVCDGVGSHENSAYSSNFIVTTLERKWKDTSFSNFDEMKNWLQSEIENINNELLERANRNDEKLATTLVACASYNDQVIIYNIGDSRAYGFSSDESVKLVTIDHSFVGALMEAGVLTEEEAKNHPKKHSLTQAVAATKELDPHIFEDSLEQYDYFLLCSDGLSNMVNSDEMNRVIRDQDLSTAVKTLITMSIERGGTDNISVAILKILRGNN